MLTNLALMFVLHVLIMGIFLGRRLEVIRFAQFSKVMLYLLGFYLSWGLIFAIFPKLIIPDLAPDLLPP